AARPGLDDLAFARRVLLVDLLEQVLVDERALFETACHDLLRYYFPGPQRRPLPVRRRRTMSFWLAFFFERVRPSGLPHGDTAGRPPDVRPSPPPSGWSTGFMATPRVCGLMPFQRLRPALPILISSCSLLPTSPTVARQSIGTRRISVDGIRSVAYSPSLATSCTAMPAERPILPPWPGRSSTLWTVVPTGMKRSGMALPGLMSAPWPDSTRSPTLRPLGARM